MIKRIVQFIKDVRAFPLSIMYAISYDNHLNITNMQGNDYFGEFHKSLVLKNNLNV